MAVYFSKMAATMVGTTSELELQAHVHIKIMCSGLVE